VRLTRMSRMCPTKSTQRTDLPPMIWTWTRGHVINRRSLREERQSDLGCPEISAGCAGLIETERRIDRDQDNSVVLFISEDPRTAAIKRAKRQFPSSKKDQGHFVDTLILVDVIEIPGKHLPEELFPFHLLRDNR